MIDYQALNEAVKDRIKELVGKDVTVGYTEPSSLAFPYVRVTRAQKDKEPEAIGIGGVYKEAVVYVVSVYTWAGGTNNKTQDDMEEEGYEITKEISQGLSGTRTINFEGVMEVEIESIKRPKQKKGLFRVDIEIVVYVEIQGG